jgi:2'-5' RNA ligase
MAYGSIVLSRLFIAIIFNSDTQYNLLALRDELRSFSKRGNYTVPENLHLTLVFLGECDAKQATDIKEVMDAITFAPFDLMIERIGRFKRNDGDLWWAGVRESKKLMDLQQKLTDRLLAKGFKFDKRQYSPHITLGRKVQTDTSPWQIPIFGETITSIDLMKSERIGGKLTYTVIFKKGAECLDNNRNNVCPPKTANSG